MSKKLVKNNQRTFLELYLNAFSDCCNGNTDSGNNNGNGNGNGNDNGNDNGNGKGKK